MRYMEIVKGKAEGYVSGLQDAAASCKPDTSYTTTLKFRTVKDNEIGSGLY